MRYLTMKTAALVMLLVSVAWGDNLPDPKLTPGATIPGVTKEQICVPGYAGTTRHVTSATKRAVFRRYQLPFVPGKYEVDHLISLELGGSNDITNLWPEAYEPRPGAHEKDKVENELHRRVCAGELPLEDAQKIISADWAIFYYEWEVMPSSGIPQ